MTGGGFPSYSTCSVERLTFAHSKQKERERVSRRQEQMVGELVNTEARVKVWRGTGWIKTRVLGYGGGYAGVVRPPVASNVDELYP